MSKEAIWGQKNTVYSHFCSKSSGRNRKCGRFFAQMGLKMYFMANMYNTMHGEKLTANYPYEEAWCWLQHDVMMPIFSRNGNAALS